MGLWSWKEGFTFALAAQLLPAHGVDVACKKTLGEKVGSQILRPLHRVIAFVSRNIKKPVAICLFTMVAALIIGVVFYRIPAFIILGRLFPTQLVRALFFFYAELNLLAMGMQAFGRFSNEGLIAMWKSNRLIVFMPGDYISK
ncbi:MAG: hypothetical protein JSR76_05160 [Verrucomicrobia bacterium]|nr:hypothetical protein [Verrucomicrobiota bacterium]